MPIAARARESAMPVNAFLGFVTGDVMSNEPHVPATQSGQDRRRTLHGKLLSVKKANVTDSEAPETVGRWTVGASSGWSSRLLVTECDQRLDVGGAPSRQVRGERGDGAQQHDDGRVRRDVEWRHAEDESTERAQDQQRAGDADGGADGHERKTAADDRAGDAGQTRAKGDANADVLRPLSNEIGEQPVEAERRQQQTADAE